MDNNKPKSIGLHFSKKLIQEILKDNMDLRRFTRPIEAKDLKRLNKYLKAYQYLTSTY